jgi:molybdopterin converting factor small subunit
MEVPVRLSSELARAAGNARVTVRLEPGATVSSLLDQLGLDYPPLSEKLNTTVAVISGRTVDRAERISPGQEVAILTPVSGG